ncbi:carboxypeptidase M32 [Longirhabdus pacifica]|uniref:carboxypeptidase M32 n=1 Tax=Longirhabdus pacifica TaxID=2305227 RepID=UPI0010090615|nr:carboxypeptidase M32 [Longirhabdus pacifica]
MHEAMISLRELDKKIGHYAEAISLLNWDLRTKAPKRSVENRAGTMGLLSAEMFQTSTSDEMGELLAKLSEPAVFDQLPLVDQKLVKNRKKEYELNTKIPPAMYKEFVELTTKAQSVWEEARHQNDFTLFQPYLEKIVEINRKKADLYGYEDHPYDALVNTYETGMNVATLDTVFNEVKEGIIPLLEKVKASKQPDTAFLKQDMDIDKQRQFGEFIAKEMGYDFNSGRIDETAHPFMTQINNGDVRITTHYKENNVMFALGGTMHETGHALYEQNIAEELGGTSLYSGTSLGIHESQSRFWENQIGFSYEFWEKYYDAFKETFPGKLDDVSLQDFYAAINQAEPNFIRIESDELTYNLHIIIRYELEKALITKELEVKDLPQAWNDKYEQYLGIIPSSDSIGVLQDVHWSMGAIGYFPTYALGNLYAAQMTETMKKQMPQYSDLIRKGDLAPIKQWMTENVYRHGSMYEPNELIQQITDEPLNASYFVNYVKEKFGSLYSL